MEKVIKKKYWILLTLLIVLILVTTFFYFRSYCVFTSGDLLYFKGRQYRKGISSVLTKEEIEQRFLVKINRSQNTSAGEVWIGDGMCQVKPCTQTVIFLKNKDGKFFEYALQGGP